MPREVIISKYFCKPVMEESLNDFRETKTKYIGPKILKKTNQKPKPKKRVKGQKDIRSLIQKKNELLAFTKDFNNACTKSGIDIDSQELQLAIALSKSLHEQNQSEAGPSQSNKTLTSQERTNQIRRTLQEYGFKVPEAKIKSEANKRVKKYKKQSKLLLITEEERREKISDRYSQILFQYPDPEDFNESDCCTDQIKEGLYYLCTNISYNLMKSNDIFHVSNVLHEITVNKGSLLRDWSNIPGRPCSPVLTTGLPKSISDIDCTQAELNTILGGTITAAKEIFKSKCGNYTENLRSETESGLFNYQCEEQNKVIICNQLLKKPEDNKVYEPKDIPTNNNLENSPKHAEITMHSPSKDRSLSPDIFGDDASSVIDNTITYNYSKGTTPKPDKTASITHILDLTGPTIINLTEPNYLVKAEISNVTKRKSNDFMDLTECLPTFTQRNKTNVISQSKTSESKIIFNDCMEITECINPSSPKFDNDNVKTNNSSKTNKDLEKENNFLTDENKVTSYDLTQSSNSDDELPRIDFHSSQKSVSSDTIIVDYDDYGQFSNNEDVIEINSENVDVEIINSVSIIEHEPQSITDNNYKLLPIEHASGNNSSKEANNINLTETSENFDMEKNYSITKDGSQHISDKTIPTEEVHENKFINQLAINEIDLTQSSVNIDIENSSSIVSFTKDVLCVSSNDQSKSMPLEEININNLNDSLENVDLTQSSDSSIQKSPIHQINHLSFDGYNNLGKIGDVSIDYDEVRVDTQIINDYCDEQFDDIQLKYGTSSGNVTLLSKNSMESSKNNLASSCSNESQVFQLSDRELNYSLCKSNIEKFKSGNICIKDDNFNLDNGGSSITKHSMNRSLSDSCLPSITFKDKINNIDKKTEKYIKLNESIHSTPIKAIIKDDKVSVQTPTNSEYLIKIREVTPMQDYAAMSSPERNKELEKYGIKPFKRKRAIQLLTHLYNQTHPIVEYCSEEPIPAKKLKVDSPKKNSQSPWKKNDGPVKSKPTQSIKTRQGKENDICYMETKDVPDIRDIECSSDDWVFQKKEKAKVHSCRVPLHIAFHNYVSCRRGLREAILRYEPVNIDVVHKDLVSYGYRYNPKDLLKFLDKKCITVKTADNNARNCKK